jgi:hypothetical protein
LRKFWNNSCMYILSWFLLVQIFDTKYDCIWPTQKRKMKICISLNSQLQSLLCYLDILSFLCRPHTIVFRLKILHKYQVNMYMQNFISDFLKLWNSIFFIFENPDPPRPVMVEIFPRQPNHLTMNIILYHEETKWNK